VLTAGKGEGKNHSIQSIASSWERDRVRGRLLYPPKSIPRKGGFPTDCNREEKEVRTAYRMISY